MDKIEKSKERLKAALDNLEKLVENTIEKQSNLKEQVRSLTMKCQKFDHMAHEVVDQLDQSINQVESLLQNKNGNS